MFHLGSAVTSPAAEVYHVGSRYCQLLIALGWVCAQQPVHYPQPNLRLRVRGIGKHCIARGWQAASAGAKDQEAVNYLEKKVKGAEALPYDAAVQLAIGALQNVLSEDLKTSDIEVQNVISTLAPLSPAWILVLICEIDLAQDAFVFIPEQGQAAPRPSVFNHGNHT